MNDFEEGFEVIEGGTKQKQPIGPLTVVAVRIQKGKPKLTISMNRETYDSFKGPTPRFIVAFNARHAMLAIRHKVQGPYESSKTGLGDRLLLRISVPEGIEAPLQERIVPHHYVKEGVLYIKLPMAWEKEKRQIEQEKPAPVVETRPVQQSEKDFEKTDSTPKPPIKLPPKPVIPPQTGVARPEPGMPPPGRSALDQREGRVAQIETGAEREARLLREQKERWDAQEKLTKEDSGSPKATRLLTTRM